MRRAPRQLEKIAQELKRAGKKAQRRGKRKDWHRLRTTSRRLRGALIAFAGSIDPSAQPKLTRKAKRITKLPAKVRDLDVALANLHLLSDLAAAPPEQRAAEDMIARLNRRRARQDHKTRQRLRRDRPVRALVQQLRKAARPPTAARPANASSALDRCARAVLDRRAAVGGWHDGDGLHALRVAVKKYRAALSSWAEAHSQTAHHSPTLAALRDVQDILGEHHDWTELAARIDSRRRKLSRGGAHPRDLAGYRSLFARARQQQKSRHDTYLARFDQKLPSLIGNAESAVASETPARANHSAGLN